MGQTISPFSVQRCMPSAKAIHPAVSTIMQRINSLAYLWPTPNRGSISEIDRQPPAYRWRLRPWRRKS